MVADARISGGNAVDAPVQVRTLVVPGTPKFLSYQPGKFQSPVEKFQRS